MGAFHIPIEIGDSQGHRYESLEALVDTGASHTVIPASVLRNLGVIVQEPWPFDLADDRVIELDVGFTMVRLDGRVRPVLVVFGAEGAEPLLGAITLETFNLAVNPIHKRLVPVHALLK
jgi:predicted aspartyl protease